MTGRHTLVLDIGKTRAKLVLIDDDGDVLTQRDRSNAPVEAEGYLALDTAGLEQWIVATMAELPDRPRIGNFIATTHGAAMCAIDESGRVMAPIDYEWDGYGAVRDDFLRVADPVADSGSPHLPLGLNAGLQIYWLMCQRPEAWRRISLWLPYAQYWAWWFSEVACSEVSSLGCHTHLWRPAEGRLSRWACTAGLDRTLAPMRSAWEVLGTLRPELARLTGLPSDCVVHAGVHDSNACLARHLHSRPGATLVSTGTWCVAMTPSGATGGMDYGRDQLINVSVEGRPIPTSRFMGGREFAHVSGGDAPGGATVAALEAVLREGWLAHPCFVAAGGPFSGLQGRISRHRYPGSFTVAEVPSALRPPLAALYCAELTDRILVSQGQRASDIPVIVEGPLAGNPAYMTALAALLSPQPLLRCHDALEGTARGAWMLADWPRRRILGASYGRVAAPELALCQAVMAHRADVPEFA